MRRIFAQIEALGATHFILLVGLIAGAIQGVPRLFLGNTEAAPSWLILLPVVGATEALSWTAALLLWWIAVRRRQSSLWVIAAHVTLGLALADLLAAALGVVVASINTHGKFAAIIAHQPGNFIFSNLTFTLLRSPLWFLGSALLIAIGRHLKTGQRPPAAAAAAIRT